MTNLNLNGYNKTKDYEMFHYLEDNRNVDKLHVKRLKEQILNCNDLHLNPIIVTSEFEVVDGQHRLEAAKELETDIYYLIDDNYTPEKMINLNTTQKRWMIGDYLNYWVSHGKTDYIKFKEFCEDLDFSPNTGLIWMSRSGGTSLVPFKQGKFKFDMVEHKLSAILSAKKLMSKMKSLNFKPKHIYKQNAFHKALKKFFQNPVVNSDKFFSQLDNYPHGLRFKSMEEGYLSLFVEIYNYNLKKNRLRFISDGSKHEIVA